MDAKTMTVPTREEIPQEHRWNLDVLYADTAAWSQDLKNIESDIPKIASYQGRLGESAAVLEKALRFYLDLCRRLEKAYTFAHLLSDTDTSNSTHLGYLERATNVYTRVAAASSFLTPELLSIDDEQLNHFLAEPELADLKRMVLDIVRYRPHTLSKEEEMILARGTEVFMTAEQVFSQLNNADLTFGTLPVDGKETALTHSNFISLLKNQDREARARVYDQYYKVFDAHKYTIAASLTGSVKKDVYLAGVKRYDSCLNRGLFTDNVDSSVYDNLIDVVSRNLEPIHRYYDLRRKALGVESLRIYDTYVPLVPDVKTRHTYAEAVDLVCGALEPLGQEYLDVLNQGLLEHRWVDRHENKGKRSGAYSSGCYDSMPYILLNYKESDLNDIFTLAHEAGHSMHSFFSRNNQAYQDHNYTIFVAEVASTFNEQLLFRHMRELHKDDERMVAYLTNQQIDEIKATLFRQTMFAEFEKIIHDSAEKNQPLTVDDYRAIYGELLRKYFGPSVSVEALDELECFRIPHFYSAFYVYKYATGISAAISLAEMVTSGGKKEQQRYLSFLKSGCSKYPLDLLKDAGVDMTSPEAIERALELFSSLVDRLGEVDVAALDSTPA